MAHGRATNSVGMEEVQTFGSMTGPLQPLGKTDGGGGCVTEMLSKGTSGHVLEDEAFFRRVFDKL